MKNKLSYPFGRAAWLLTTTLVFAVQAAQACPGGKEVVVEGQQVVNPASMGFAYSIGFMFLMAMSVIGSLVWMMVKSAQANWRPADENAYSVPSDK